MAIPFVIAGTATGAVVAVFLLWVWLTARPVRVLLGLSVPDLIALILLASGVAWGLVLALVRRAHPEAASDYEDP